MIRSVEIPLALSDDGRGVFGRIFPLNTFTHIREMNPTTGEIEEYDECFLPGCTSRIRQVAQKRGGPAWIGLSLDHKQGFDFQVGYCRSLAETESDVEADFHLYEGGQLEKVKSMLRDSHTGMSIEFEDHVQPIIEGNTRKRRQIDIFRVTATPIPAYTDARILAMRSDGDRLDLGGTPNLDKAQAMMERIS